MKKQAVTLGFSIAVALSVPALAAPKTVTLAVPDMNCPVCPITLKKSIGQVNGVTRVEANLERKEATITFDDAKTSVEALRKASADAGFPASVKH